MTSTVDFIKQIFTLTNNVDSLIKDIERFQSIISDHNERIIKLESRDKLLAEQARNAALEAVIRTNGALQKEVHEVQKAIRCLQEANNRPRLTKE